MSTIYTHRSGNIARTWFLMLGFLVFVIALSYGVAFYLNNPAILYGGVILALVMNVGSYWFSDKLVLKMTNAKPVTKQEAPELYTIVENLSITAGLPMPKVYVVDDAAPNAFATGRNADHAVVAVTTGLLTILNKNELEGVVAHELAHIGNRDMLVMTVAVVLAGFVAILADFLSRGLLFGGDREQRNPIFAVVAIVGIILAPLAAQLMQLAISRKREYLADATGALLTRYPEGLAAALEKINGAHMPMHKPSTATAHLFIADPFARSGFGAKVAGLFATHPPAAERIKRLRQMDL